jgi:hypothetical protein
MRGTYKQGAIQKLENAGKFQGGEVVNALRWTTNVRVRFGASLE